LRRCDASTALKSSASAPQYAKITLSLLLKSQQSLLSISCVEQIAAANKPWLNQLTNRNYLHHSNPFGLPSTIQIDTGEDPKMISVAVTSLSVIPPFDRYFMHTAQCPTNCCHWDRSRNERCRYVFHWLICASIRMVPRHILDNSARNTHENSRAKDRTNDCRFMSSEQ